MWALVNPISPTCSPTGTGGGCCGAHPSATSSPRHTTWCEARILSALADTPVPVPHIHAVCTDTSVSPAPLVVMEHVDATVLDNLPAAEALSVQQRRSVGKSMVDTLATIHEVDIDAVGLADLASHKPYAERQVKRVEFAVGEVQDPATSRPSTT